MINAKYKDRLFCFLFTDPTHKEHLISLYNALNGTNYSNPADLEITTISDVVYMGMKNDVSCIIDNYMNLIEHQSSINPNMPLRGFFYFGKLYEKYTASTDISRFSSKLLKIPTPQYFVLYNGIKEMPDKTILRLSDSYIHNLQNPGDFEWTATVLNIRQGHNKQILEACSILNEYSVFTDTIYSFLASGNTAEAAVNLAVDRCVEKNILGDFLKSHKAEVIGMFLTEYNAEKEKDLFIKEGFEEGFEKGQTEIFNAVMDARNGKSLNELSSIYGNNTAQIAWKIK